MIVSGMQAQDMMESGVFPDLLAAGREERKEEVMVYHSLANDRACHMVLPEGVPPQVYLHLDKWSQFTIFQCQADQFLDQFIVLPSLCKSSDQAGVLHPYLSPSPPFPSLCSCME